MSEPSVEGTRLSPQQRRLAISQLTRPEQVELRAQRELGMQPPLLAQTAFYEELVQ